MSAKPGGGGIVFPSSFIRQLDDYSCGPACLATVARLFGVDRDYGFFRDLMDPCPEIGSRPEKMAAGARAHLPYSGHGEGTYTGGVAIANIIHVSDVEEGHYVVFLERRGDDFVYYDPYDHDILRVGRADLRWESDDDPPLIEWTINFRTLPGMDFNSWLRVPGG